MIKDKRGIRSGLNGNSQRIEKKTIEKKLENFPFSLSLTSEIKEFSRVRGQNEKTLISRLITILRSLSFVKFFSKNPVYLQDITRNKSLNFMS